MSSILSSLASVLPSLIPSVKPEITGNVDPQVEVKDSCNCCASIFCCFPFKAKKHTKDCESKLVLDIDVKVKDLLK